MGVLGRADSITDPAAQYRGEALDLVCSARTSGPSYLAKEHLSHAQSVTVLAESTIPQMYYFNRNHVLVSHTLLL